MEPSRFDVVVVGAGPIGAAAARHLALEVDSIALVGPVEAEDFRNHRGPWSGWCDEGRMAHALDLPLLSGLIGLRARRRFRALEEETGVTFAFAVPAVSVMPSAGAGGSLDATPEGAGEYFDPDLLLARALDLGVRAEQLDGDGLRETFPGMRFAEGHVGIHQPDARLISARRLVRAETMAAVAAGATRVVDEVASVHGVRGGGLDVVTRSGRRLSAGRVVLAAGAYINAAHLAPAPLAFRTFGATVTLAPVDGPQVSRTDQGPVTFPTTMYLKVTDRAPFAGIITPPLQYPDGRWYIKGAGAGLLERPLHSDDEIETWVGTGGDASDRDEFAPVLAELLPGVVFGDIVTRPCLITMNDTGHPYIGFVDNGLLVATEGEHGVTMADEIGRLVARLVVDGNWRDPLPAELFAPRFASG